MGKDYTNLKKNKKRHLLRSCNRNNNDLMREIYLFEDSAWLT